MIDVDLGSFIKKYFNLRGNRCLICFKFFFFNLLLSCMFQSSLRLRDLEIKFCIASYRFHLKLLCVIFYSIWYTWGQHRVESLSRPRVVGPKGRPCELEKNCKKQRLGSKIERGSFPSQNTIFFRKGGNFDDFFLLRYGVSISTFSVKIFYIFNFNKSY